MLVVSLLFLIVVALTILYGLAKWRRTPQTVIVANATIGSEAMVGPGGLSGRQLGTIAYSGASMPAQIATGDAGRDVMAQGASVTVKAIEMGVAQVEERN